MESAPIEDELLTSILCRLSHRYGMSPYQFCKQHFPAWNIWRRDVDRCKSDLLKQHEEFLGIGDRGIAGHLLSSYSCVLNGYESGLHYSAISPWINATGVYHHVVDRYGLVFCPHCLDEKPGFVRPWRLSFNLYCVDHCVELVDRCPLCQSPISLQRQRLSIGICACGCRLNKIRTLNEADVGSKAFQLQEALGSALLSGVYRFEGLDAPLHEVLGFLRSVTVATQGRFGGHGNHSLIKFMKGPQIELCSLSDRKRKMKAYSVLLSEWPGAFLRYAKELNLTQLVFRSKQITPPWLSEVLSYLPPGNPRDREPDASNAQQFSMKILRNRYLKYERWRERHAALMMKAVRKNGV